MLQDFNKRKKEKHNANKNNRRKSSKICIAVLAHCARENSGHGRTDSGQTHVRIDSGQTHRRTDSGLHMYGQTHGRTDEIAEQYCASDMRHPIEIHAVL